MGKIQNQLNQLMLSGLGGAIAYQHSPATTRARTMKQDFGKLSTLATESGDIPFIKAFDPKLSKVYDKEQLQAIRDYMASGKEETDYETLMEAIGFDLNEEPQAQEVQSRLERDILPAIKDYDDLIDMYEGSYKRFLSNLNPDELTEVISTNEYNGRRISPPHQLRQDGEEFIAPLRTKEGLVQKYFSKDADIEAIGKRLAEEDEADAKKLADAEAKKALKAEAETLANRPFSQKVKDFFISPSEQTAMADRKQARMDARQAKENAHYTDLINQERKYLADTREERNNYLKSLEEAQEAKKGIKDAVPERSILLKPESVLHNPGYAEPKPTETVVQNPGYNPFTKPETVVKKPSGTVLKKGASLPETPDTFVETDTTIFEKPGSRLYKG